MSSQPQSAGADDVAPHWFFNPTQCRALHVLLVAHQSRDNADSDVAHVGGAFIIPQDVLHDRVLMAIDRFAPLLALLADNSLPMPPKTSSHDDALDDLALYLTRFPDDARAYLRMEKEIMAISIAQTKKFTNPKAAAAYRDALRTILAHDERNAHAFCGLGYLANSKDVFFLPIPKGPDDVPVKMTPEGGLLYVQHDMYYAWSQDDLLRRALEINPCHGPAMTYLAVGCTYHGTVCPDGVKRRKWKMFCDAGHWAPWHSFALHNIAFGLSELAPYSFQQGETVLYHLNEDDTNEDTGLDAVGMYLHTLSVDPTFSISYSNLAFLVRDSVTLRDGRKMDAPGLLVEAIRHNPAATAALQRLRAFMGRNSIELQLGPHGTPRTYTVDELAELEKEAARIINSNDSKFDDSVYVLSAPAVTEGQQPDGDAR
eukprot:PhM_4_TR17970/c0_g1_i1/m.20422